MLSNDIYTTFEKSKTKLTERKSVFSWNPEQKQIMRNLFEITEIFFTSISIVVALLSTFAKSHQTKH
jgi:hypothetical protein